METKLERYKILGRVNLGLPFFNTCSLSGQLSARKPTPGVFNGVHELYITLESGKWTHYRSRPAVIQTASIENARTPRTGR
ncbi:MAG: hypothetical protein ACQESR_07160, partial [Planctomycetota bacterium]